MAVKFSFVKVRYFDTPRGVHCCGKVKMGRRNVGTFDQRPYEVIHAFFDSKAHRQWFEAAADTAGLNVYDYAERLLKAAEDRYFASHPGGRSWRG